ncbi:PqiA/YebS family transporter subunit [Vibrio zhugei]|uniref:PqiA/YebS family transporter subunit n=1 Tax=Vibrio zhugei TaxID=2479546 RepID=A0ABV7C7J0_9VIBR|nr:paraquat-inducible protein A [Vibrio zhugei]
MCDKTPAIATTRLCQGCDLPLQPQPLDAKHDAYCPRCNTQLSRGGSPSLSGNLAIAITCMCLFIPAYTMPFLSVRLLGVTINGSLWHGIEHLYNDGFAELAALVMFCAIIAPVLLCSALILCHIALHKRWFMGLRIGSDIIYRLKGWAMIDVFLVAIAIASFKLKDYADLMVGPALYALIMLQILTVLLISRVSIRRYWEAWRSEITYQHESKDVHCLYCHFSQPAGTHCQRCHHRLHKRRPQSIERTWAYLIAATVAIFPANLIPISILLTNGQHLDDTIYSGVVSLFNSHMAGIAIIILIASILVPMAKILGLGYILVSIQFKRMTFAKHRMRIFFIIKMIGKWSMLDLFVISIMLTLVDRGQLLNFIPGNGAVAFGLVVVLTLLATESLDPRLMWDCAATDDNTQKRSVDE